MQKPDAAKPKEVMVHTVSDEQRESLRGWLQVAINLLVVIGSALAGWSFNQTLLLRSEVDQMRASQFTAANGLEVWKDISACKERMASMPTETRVARIEQSQQIMLQEIASIKVLLERIEKRM